MRFELPPLPYDYDALAPHLSAATLETHYEKHHAGYLEKLEKAIAGTPLAKLEIEEIIRRTARDEEKQAVFHNAAQVFNHNFYWLSMTPRGGGKPEDQALAAALDHSFGSLEKLRERFVTTAEGLFGSGYVWLVVEASGHHVRLEAMKDADDPILTGDVPLIGCDVWEHAYYLDHRNERRKYAELFFDHLINWETAAGQLAVAPSNHAARKRA